MNNGKSFSDIQKESSVIGSIISGSFDRLPEKSLIPEEAFFDARHRIIYMAAKSLRLTGVTTCKESVSDFLREYGADRDLQKIVDPTNTVNWTAVWKDSDTSEAYGEASGRNLEYVLSELKELYNKREALRIAERMQSGELSPAKAIEELREISPEARAFPPMVSAKDLCLKPPPTPPEVIQGILHQGSKLAFGGGSKSFKTWMLLELSICVAKGRDWLDFSTQKGSVLYVNFELPAFAMEKRIREICDAMCVDVPQNLIVWNLRGHATDASTILPIVSREAKAAGFTLIILDPLYKLLGARDENASRDMANLMNHVERLAVDTGAAAAFGSHYSKGNQSGKESMDRISGSGVFARDPDSIVTMTAHEVTGALSVEMTLRNFPPQESFVVRREHPLMVVDGQLDPTKLKKPIGRTAEHKPEDILQFIESDALRTTEWQEAAEEEGIKDRTFYRLKQELIKAGKVFQSKIDKKWSSRV